MNSKKIILTLLHYIFVFCLLYKTENYYKIRSFLALELIALSIFYYVWKYIKFLENKIIIYLLLSFFCIIFNYFGYIEIIEALSVILILPILAMSIVYIFMVRSLFDFLFLFVGLYYLYIVCSIQLPPEIRSSIPDFKEYLFVSILINILYILLLNKNKKILNKKE